MVESNKLEWKESWRDEYIKWICGFANSSGGKLEIGRNDEGEVVGVQDYKKLMEDLPNKIRDTLGIMVDVNLKTKAQKKYIQIVIKPYPYPVSYRGSYFYRSGSTNQELKGDALDRFLLQKQGKHWDGVPVPHVKIADLKKELMGGFRHRAIESGRFDKKSLTSNESLLLEKLHLKERSYLKRAAILLFHEYPQQHFTGAYLKLGYFGASGEIKYQDKIEGGLISQISNTTELILKKYLMANISYEGIQRVEKYPIPEIALREALTNAITHKDYSSGIPIQIRIEATSISIWNPGQLPANWTIKDLLSKHKSIPFNPDIAHSLFQAGLIEAWGQGIERMKNACEQAGNECPKFEIDSQGFSVTFNFEAVSESFPLKRIPNKDQLRSLILTLIKKNPTISQSKIATELNITIRSVQICCEHLTKEGLLKRIGPTKGGSWEVIK